MKINGKCNNSHAHSTSVSGILLSVRTQIEQTAPHSDSPLEVGSLPYKQPIPPPTVP